ncbi:MAG: BON domain-containing protein [Planctomycetota bacterium]|nr:BON domain-containing protein [Planctomycetota bacterium]
MPTDGSDRRPDEPSGQPLQNWFEDMLVALPEEVNEPDPDADFELRQDSRIKRPANVETSKTVDTADHATDALDINAIPIVSEHLEPELSLGDRHAELDINAIEIVSEQHLESPSGRSLRVTGPQSVPTPPQKPATTRASQRPETTRRPEKRSTRMTTGNDAESSDADIASFLAEEPAPQRKPEYSAANTGQPVNDEPANDDPVKDDAVNDVRFVANAANLRADEDLQFRIEREVQKYPVAAAAKVQFRVQDGNVTIVGEVATDYEKQLIVHFTKSVTGVVAVVDLMRALNSKSASQPAAAAVAPRPAPKRKSTGGGVSWQLPFKPSYAGIAVCLVAIVWASISFGRKDDGRLKVYPVTGRVTVDGKGPDGAMVVLHPVLPSNSARPKATVKPDGTFTLMTYTPGDGAPEGEYKLTIVWHQLTEVNGEPSAGPNLLPVALSRADSTTHKVVVKQEKNEIPVIQIQP